MPDPLAYLPAERPTIEIEIEGGWRPAKLIAWYPSGDGTWVGNVEYATASGENTIATLPKDRIRTRATITTMNGGPRCGTSEPSN
jgi:hypothetical protein